MNQSSPLTFILLLCSGILAGCEPASRDSSNRLTTSDRQTENAAAPASAEPTADTTAVSPATDLPNQPLFSIPCDFGRAKEGQTFTRAIEIANPSQVPWTLRDIDSPCTCTVAERTFDVIPPAERRTINLTYRAPHRTHDDERAVKFHFEEFPNRPGVVTVTAWVRRAAEVNPESVAFGSLARGRSFERVLLVQNFSDFDWQSIGLTSSDEWLSGTVAELPQVTDSPDKRVTPRQQWRLVVTVATSGLASREFRGALTVKPVTEATNETVSLSVPVSLIVQRPVSVIPGRLFAGRIAPGETKSSRLSLRYSPGAEPEDGPQIVNAHPDVVNLALSRSGEGLWTLTADVSVPDDGQLPESLSVTLAGEAESDVVIPIYVRVPSDSAEVAIQ